MITHTFIKIVLQRISLENKTIKLKNEQTSAHSLHSLSPEKKHERTKQNLNLQACLGKYILKKGCCPNTKLYKVVYGFQYKKYK